MNTELVFGISIVLFTGGIFLVLTRRNAVIALVGVELLLNAATVNFVGFNRLYPGSVEGHLAALVVLVIAAAEAAVALAVLLNVYRRARTVDLNDLQDLNG
jgi:NADH-quinone oxidoreductase subunit K